MPALLFCHLWKNFKQADYFIFPMPFFAIFGRQCGKQAILVRAGYFLALRPCVSPATGPTGIVTGFTEGLLYRHHFFTGQVVNR